MTSRVPRTWLAMILAALMLAVSAGAAQACAIHNDTNVKMTIWFDCGVACGNYFDIKPGQTASRPGKAGRVFAGFVDDDGYWQCQQHFARAADGLRKDEPIYTEVSAHGEAVVTNLDQQKNDSLIHWVVYDASNKVVGRTTMHLFGNSVPGPCSWGTP